MFSNDIGDVGAAALAEALLRNATLEDLDLEENNISPAYYDEITSLLSTGNRYKRRLELEKSTLENDPASAKQGVSNSSNTELEVGDISVP